MKWKNFLLVSSAFLLFAQQSFSIDCPPLDGRSGFSFSGHVSGGEKYSQSFGPNFIFTLEPIEKGWAVVITRDGSQENLARLTPTQPSGLNPRLIEGWNFRNPSNSAPADMLLPATQIIRYFSFSPEVGKTMDQRKSNGKPSEKEMQSLQRFGRGQMTITDYGLADLFPGQRARAVYLAFDVCLSWPADYLKGYKN